ncbi:uncharacterized protein SCHCODRAFT_02492270 [Schizophyllum commune H4-8]|uniref:uncharacterized protein n=1 Tax=Schizophyllum commune (strain H4-8 / FGSC 9210) TaxID=578458 RepID=UPI00215F2AAA|nr:uncharacterized protein SCHCODRAFT_02492270 [Schizophyllum commune H4-8]KAI5895962.1 hypothetical protein SCHCODRAFT_02492270 [Schizophyllum commune H4-8]
MKISNIDCQVRSDGITLREYDTEYPGEYTGKSYIVSQEKQMFSIHVSDEGQQARQGTCDLDVDVVIDGHLKVYTILARDGDDEIAIEGLTTAACELRPFLFSNIRFLGASKTRP